MSKKQKHPKLDKNDGMTSGADLKKVGKLKTKSKKVVEIPIFVPAFNLPYDYEAVAWDEDQIAGVMLNLKEHAKIGAGPMPEALRSWDYLPDVVREKHYRRLARLRIAEARIRFGIDQAQQQITDLAMHRTVLTQKIEAIREARQAVEALPFPNDADSNQQTEYLKVLDGHEPDLVEERQAIIDQHGGARQWRRDATRELKTMMEQEVVFRSEVSEQARVAKSLEAAAGRAWGKNSAPKSLPDEEICPPLPFKGFDTATVIRFRKWLGEENGNRVYDYVAIRRNNEDDWSLAGGLGNMGMRNYSWSALLDFMRSDETEHTIQRVYDSVTLLCDAPESMQPRRSNWRRPVLSWPSYLISRWNKNLMDYKELLDGTPVMLRDGGPRSLPINGATQVGPLYEGGPVASISTSVARASMI